MYNFKKAICLSVLMVGGLLHAVNETVDVQKSIMPGGCVKNAQPSRVWRVAKTGLKVIGALVVLGVYTGFMIEVGASQQYKYGKPNLRHVRAIVPEGGMRSDTKDLEVRWDDTLGKSRDPRDQGIRCGTIPLVPLIPTPRIDSQASQSM